MRITIKQHAGESDGTVQAAPGYLTTLIEADSRVDFGWTKWDQKTGLIVAANCGLESGESSMSRKNMRRAAGLLRGIADRLDKDSLRQRS